MADKLTDDQKTVVKTLESPLFVAAGAGSGKSSTLAKRVCQAFLPREDGRPPYLSSLDEVLVITFTHAAADEIKEKIRSQLREAGLAEQALQVDSAWISTIHGMCSRILRRHALDLGIDPGFQLIDETTQQAMTEDAINEVIGEIQRGGGYGELRAAFDMRPRSAAGSGGHGFKGAPTIMGMVRDLRAAAASALDGFDSIVIPGTAPDIAHDASGLADAYAGLLAEGIAEKSFESASGAAARPQIETSISCLEELASPVASHDAQAVRQASGRLYRPAKNFGSKAYKAKAGEVRDLYEAFLLDAAFAALGLAASDLVEIARAVDGRYRARKAEAGLLDNDDLLMLAYKAFRDHPDIAAEYSDRFKLVMVDEFQDTNAQQVRMIELLSGPGACHLCTVGDAQQSIYRFRAADVAVFQDRERELRSSDEDSLVQMSVNFRSHADVLAYVEKVLGHGLLPGFMPLEPAKKHNGAFRAAGAPRAGLELVSAPQGVRGKVKGTTSEQRSGMLAAMLADRASELIAAGEDAGRIVLLLGRMRNVDIYLDAFRARGIDCVVSGGSTFAASEDVKLVAALLRMLANPKDTERGLFPVLDSDLFLLDADDFCALATKTQDNGAYGKRGIDVGLLGDSFADGVVPSARLKDARDVVRRALSRVGSWQLADILEAVLRESGWLARRQAEGPEGLARAANALAAIRFASELADAHGFGCARAAEEFSRWLEVAKQGPASLSGGPGGAVRIMTVHASKGLQFPIVLAAECWGEASGDVAGLTCENRGGTVYCALVPAGVDAATLKAQAPDEASRCETAPEWAGFLTRERKEADDAEKARLLYVAMTRAEEAAILGMEVTTTSKKRGTLLAEGVLDALVGPGEMPPVGESGAGYGGELPCRIRHVALSVDEDGVLEADAAGSFADADAVAARLSSAGRAAEEPEPFGIYAQDVEDGPAWALGQARAWRPEGDITSYSRLHESLRDAAPAPAPARPAMPELADQEDPDDMGQDGAPADEDRATDLGQAFHELAQAMVEAPEGALPPELVAARERTFRLRPRQRERLEEALGRWERSEIRREALAHDRVRAEVPFCCDAGAWGLDGADAGLAAGRFDLLAYDDGSDAALVIDYKTGDRSAAPEELRARHDMQAACYAAALMELGFASVECAFVCVERDASDAGGRAGEPLVLRYSFDSARPPLAVLALR